MTRPSSARSLLLGLGLLAALGLGTQCQRQTDAAAAVAAGAAPKSRSAAPDGPAQDPRPDRVRLLVSGSMQGRLEPCGCSSGQLGGLPRRMQHIAEQLGYDLMLEGGGMTQGATELDVLKVSTALLVLFQMQHAYDALGIDRTDLALPLDEWIGYLGMVPCVVASDLECTREDWPALPFVEKTVRGQTVRVASFTRALPAALSGDQSPFRLLDPGAAWRRALDGAAAATLRVLLLHDTDAAARRLIPTLEPAPDLVVCLDQSYSEPPAHPELLAGVPIVYPGIRGRVLLELTLARGPGGPQLGYDLVQLRASKTAHDGGGDPDVRQILREHRDYVAEDGVLQRMANRAPTANGAEYVGNAACAQCHGGAMKAWEKTVHARAWQTLVDAEADPQRYGWPVTRYPDCVHCHVVGYGEQSGFVDAETTPNLRDVGCERCHGAGSRHVDDPEAHRLGIARGRRASELCAECHDFEQSPDFLYDQRWPKIEHGLEPGMRER